MKKIYPIVLSGLLFMSFLSHAQTCGTTNIAQGKPVDVSAQQEYHPGSDAVDGNLATGWYVPTDTSMITVDLQQSYTLCSIAI
jgi:hypothetical protein